MAALTEDRPTIERDGRILSFPVASNTLCYGGGIATLGTTGYVRPGTVDASSPASVAVGRFRRRYDNRTATDVALREAVAEVEPGIFKWANHTTDTITAAHVLRKCYVVDDQTVANSSSTNTRGPAGVVVAVDDDGVWVATGIPVPLL